MEQKAETLYQEGIQKHKEGDTSQQEKEVLREGDTINVNMFGVEKSFCISTEDSLCHGHGYPDQYNFVLSKKETSLVNWFIKHFKAEDYTQEITNFFNENNCRRRDIQEFIRGIDSSLKLMTKAVQKAPQQPDLILHGEYDNIGFTINFRQHRLLNIVAHNTCKYDEKGYLVEVCSAYEKEIFKYNEKGKKTESYTYNNKGELETVSTWSGERSTGFCRFGKENKVEYHYGDLEKLLLLASKARNWE